MREARDEKLEEYEAANDAFYKAYLAWDDDGEWNEEKGWTRRDSPDLVAALKAADERLVKALEDLRR